MGDNSSGAIHDSSEGGIAGKHPDAAMLTLLVAPSTAQESNSARLRLIPVACWRVDDIRFAFDSSFVTPDITSELQILVGEREANKKEEIATKKILFPPLSVFGHADPTGTDAYNKTLSGRRAAVIYALLISNSDPQTAVGMWQRIAVAENWGSDARRTMAATAGMREGSPDRDLFKAYMKAICPPELQLTRKDFLSQGADLGGKGDFQGCGEFNPVQIFSAEKNSKFEQASDKSERNLANATNRRVVVLLFRPGSQVDPTRWPCPRASEDAAGCHKRFWSDGESRRSSRLPSEDRTFDQTSDTFACRFYQRLALGSPCETIRSSGPCFAFLKLFDDSFEKVLANQEYELVGLTRGLRIKAKTKDDGIARHENIPDDHYLLLCGGKTETVEVYYMEEKGRYDGKPWFMRVRGLGSADEAQGI